MSHTTQGKCQILQYHCGIDTSHSCIFHEIRSAVSFLHRGSKLTSTSFIQLPFPKPELGSVDGAGVELQPEHSVSVSTLGSPVVAFDLQRAAEKEEGQL